MQIMASAFVAKTYSVQPTVTQPSEIAKKCDHLVKKMEEL